MPPRGSQDEDGARHAPKAASFPAERQAFFEQFCFSLELAPGSYHHPKDSLEFGCGAATASCPKEFHAFQPQAFRLASFARLRSPCMYASQETLCRALARAAVGVPLDFASASSSHLRPSSKCPRKYQNSPSAAAIRSVSLASPPCPSDQESAALMLLCSSSSRSTHSTCCAPSTAGSASSARARKYSA